MSYTRMGSDGSDLYIIGEIGGGSRCVGCSLNANSFVAATENEMLVHVAEHRARGEHVPLYVDERLRAERLRAERLRAERSISPQ